eukprot:4465549-Prymnesium_polylepis.1
MTLLYTMCTNYSRNEPQAYSTDVLGGPPSVARVQRAPGFQPTRHKVGMASRGLRGRAAGINKRSEGCSRELWRPRASARVGGVQYGICVL